LSATAEVTLLSDALPEIDFVATPGVTRSVEDELPLHIVNQSEFLEMVTNTIKPLMVLIAGGPELSDIYDMAELVAGGPTGSASGRSSSVPELGLRCCSTSRRSTSCSRLLSGVCRSAARPHPRWAPQDPRRSPARA
jgi:hypothetical protein